MHNCLPAIRRETVTIDYIDYSFIIGCSSKQIITAKGFLYNQTNLRDGVDGDVVKHPSCG